MRQKTSVAYERGYRWALRGLSVSECPYGGHNDGSLALQRKWLNGHFDAMTNPEPQPAPKRQQRFLTRRRTVRKVMPRSQYARRQLMAAGVSRTREVQQ